MSNSDKEFEEYFDKEIDKIPDGGDLTVMDIVKKTRDLSLATWNHLYEQLNVSKAQIKEKEDVIKSLEERERNNQNYKDAFAFSAELTEKDKIIQTLEAKVKELTDDNNEADITIEKYFNKAKTLEAKVKELEECKLVNYGELDLKLSDYLKTDDIILISTKDRSEIVDHILKMVDSCSYPSEIQKETASVVEKLRGEE